MRRMMKKHEHGKKSKIQNKVKKANYENCEKHGIEKND